MATSMYTNMDQANIGKETKSSQALIFLNTFATKLNYKMYACMYVAKNVCIFLDRFLFFFFEIQLTPPTKNK